MAEYKFAKSRNGVWHICRPEQQKLYCRSKPAIVEEIIREEKDFIAWVCTNCEFAKNHAREEMARVRRYEKFTKNHLVTIFKPHSHFIRYSRSTLEHNIHKYSPHYYPCRIRRLWHIEGLARLTTVCGKEISFKPQDTDLNTNRVERIFISQRDLLCGHCLLHSEKECPPFGWKKNGKYIYPPGRDLI